MLSRRLLSSLVSLFRPRLLNCGFVAVGALVKLGSGLGARVAASKGGLSTEFHSLALTVLVPVLLIVIGSLFFGSGNLSKRRVTTAPIKTQLVILAGGSRFHLLTLLIWIRRHVVSLRFLICAFSVRTPKSLELLCRVHLCSVAILH